MLTGRKVNKVNKKMVFEGAVGVAIGFLVGIALLKYSGYVDHIKKELGYIGSGAMFILLAQVLPATGAQELITEELVNMIGLFFGVIAFILILVGAITMIIDLIRKIK